MKSKLLVTVLFAIAGAGAVQAQGMKGMEMKEAKGEVHRTTGIVTRVDKGKVMIKHDPVPSLKWPTMTMAFAVKDKAVMDKLAKDKKIDFEFTKEGKDYVVTSVK